MTACVGIPVADCTYMWKHCHPNTNLSLSIPMQSYPTHTILTKTSLIQHCNGFLGWYSTVMNFDLGMGKKTTLIRDGKYEVNRWKRGTVEQVKGKGRQNLKSTDHTIARNTPLLVVTRRRMTRLLHNHHLREPCWNLSSHLVTSSVTELSAWQFVFVSELQRRWSGIYLLLERENTTTNYTHHRQERDEEADDWGPWLAISWYPSLPQEVERWRSTVLFCYQDREAWRHLPAFRDSLCTMVVMVTSQQQLLTCLTRTGGDLAPKVYIVLFFLWINSVNYSVFVIY